MYYLFIINSIDMGKYKLEASEILSYLYMNKTWAFSNSAPNIKQMSIDDKAIIYIAGKKYRAFAASLTIASNPSIDDSNKDEPNWLKLFPVRIKVKDFLIWGNPIKIREILEDLDFIYDKKNYGLFLRNATTIISHEDYNHILNHFDGLETQVRQ